MAFGDKLMKKVTGKTSSQRATDAAAATGPPPHPSHPARSHNSNISLLSTSSSASGGDGNSLTFKHVDHREHKDGFPSHPQFQPHQQPRPYHQPHHRAASAPLSSLAKPMPAMALGSVSGSSVGSGSTAIQGPAPEIIQKGYLMVKKGMLKGFEKRFYFLTAQSADLFCFRDESQFDEWRTSGLPVRRIPSHRKHKDSGHGPAMPKDVLTVLRADRSGEGASARDIAVISGDEQRCSSTKFLAPTAEACEEWIQSFHRVQLTRRAGGYNSTRDGFTAPGPKAAESTTPSSSSSHSAGRTAAMPPAHDGQHTPQHHHQHQHQQYQPQYHGRSAATSAPPAAGTPHSSGHSSRVSDVSDSPSQHSGHSNNAPFGPHAGAAHTPSHQHRTQAQAQGHQTTTTSTISGSASAPAAPASGNVLLFVPAAGSAISISDSKLQQAKKEMVELVTKGAKRPMRGGVDNTGGTAWRYGTPEYVLSDLEYIKGKTRDHDATPLESYAEMCCQTFLMEATHKARYADWTSVRQEYFYIQVNDGEKIPGHQIKENDLFGLLYLNDYEVDMELRDGEERKDPRAILSEAFTQGFPMEVLDVYTQPPQCHFSWRHWGRFTGRYRGVRGNGELIELRGFGHMHIDSGRLLNLQLFFKQRDLFDQLNKITASALAATPVNRTNRQATAASASDAGFNVAPTSSAPAAPPAPAPTPSSKPSAAPAPTAASQPQPHLQQQRQVRSDKLTVDKSSGDFRQVNSARSQRPASSSSLPAISASQQPQQQQTTAPKRTQLYQQFMPQATGA